MPCLSTTCLTLCSLRRLSNRSLSLSFKNLNELLFSISLSLFSLRVDGTTYVHTGSYAGRRPAYDNLHPDTMPLRRLLRLFSYGQSQ
jgi:hypothetical protein